MGAAEELALVVKALKSGLGGCVEWDPDEADRVRKDFDNSKLNVESIKRSVIEYVRNGGRVRQVTETRRERAHRKFYYKVIVPLPDVFKKGLFVEMELVNSDPELPEVKLVNAHEQK